MVNTALAVDYSAIESASVALRDVAHNTPVLTSQFANEVVCAQLFFKCENFQRAGAFKFRGAYNAIRLLSAEQKKKGVVAFSSGNHAQAIALASRLLGVEATIVMPYDAPKIKLAATRGYGAKVVLYKRGIESREAVAQQVAASSGAVTLPPFDHPHIIAGQGTAAKELFESVGVLDYLFVCCGGGGLLSGSAIAAKHLSPDCSVVGVEPEAGNDASQSFRAGQIIEIPVPNTIADGAQTQRLGNLTFPIMQALVKDMLTVSDDQLRRQMRFFAERMKIVVEPTGCLAAASVMSGAIDLTGKRVGVIVSGGNVDPIFFGECLAQEGDLNENN